MAGPKPHIFYRMVVPKGSLQVNSVHAMFELKNLLLRFPITGLLYDKHLVELLVLYGGATLPGDCNLKMAGLFMTYPLLPMELLYPFLLVSTGCFLACDSPFLETSHQPTGSLLAKGDNIGNPPLPSMQRPRTDGVQRANSLPW